MDLKAPNWHGRLKIEGIANDHRLSGSIQQMLGQIMGIIIQAKARTNGEGAKVINITLSDTPISESTIDAMRRVNDAEGMILHENMATWDPNHDSRPDEDYVAMQMRLIRESDYNPVEAEYWAREAFDYPPNPDDAKRLRDTRWAAFRGMNASVSAYEACDKKEYESLNRYCKDTYPVEYGRLNLRG